MINWRVRRGGISCVRRLRQRCFNSYKLFCWNCSVIRGRWTQLLRNVRCLKLTRIEGSWANKIFTGANIKSSFGGKSSLGGACFPLPKFIFDKLGGFATCRNGSSFRRSCVTPCARNSSKTVEDATDSVSCFELRDAHLAQSRRVVILQNSRVSGFMF